MARIRSVKPGFFKSEDVSALSFRARLTWVGLWTQCDDAGRTKDNVKLIKADVWPLDDVSLRDVEDDLVELAAHGRIVRYEADGKQYLQITNWHHQRIQKPTPSVIPPPTGTTPSDSGSSPVGVSDSYPLEGKGGEGKGGDARARASPPACPKHANNPNPPPCGPCADARRAAAAQPTPTPPPANAVLRSQPERDDDINRHGVDAVRAALAARKEAS